MTYRIWPIVDDGAGVVVAQLYGLLTAELTRQARETLESSPGFETVAADGDCLATVANDFTNVGMPSEPKRASGIAANDGRRFVWHGSVRRDTTNDLGDGIARIGTARRWRIAHASESTV
jgi:hypothetical protein